jgi:hypothetical protein
MSKPGHDAFDANGDVQIKMTAGNSVSMYDACDRRVVLKVVSPRQAEFACDGDGHVAWEDAGRWRRMGAVDKALEIARVRGTRA